MGGRLASRGRMARRESRAGRGSRIGWRVCNHIGSLTSPPQIYRLGTVDSFPKTHCSAVSYDHCQILIEGPWGIGGAQT